MRKLVRLAILLLIAHALYRFIPVYVHYQQFKDAAAEAALFSKDRSDAEVLERIVALGQRYRIPLDPEAVQITRDGQLTRIRVEYVEHIEWVPTYKRPLPFTVSVEGWHVRPTGVDPLR